MSKRNDIEKVLLIGSGPNIIGQNSEYDFHMTQALRTLKVLGIKSVVVNSNPSTVSTNVELADYVYIEPLDIKHLSAIIARENPSAIIPLFGGQKALNLTSELSRSGVLERYDVKVIGVDSSVIDKTENRVEFKKLLLDLGLDMARSSSASSVEEAENIAKYIGFPIAVRPAFTIGGFGSGLVYNIQELREVVSNGIQASMVKSVLLEKAVLGWKEVEIEALRDSTNQVVIAGMIEYIDPMGVHNGDSMSVTPPQTISDYIVDLMKKATIKIANKLSVNGSINVQFACKDDELIVLEVNVRTTRTTSLVSQAYGLPMAEIVTKLALNINLSEIVLPQSSLSLDSYEPNIDYIVIKAPKWSMNKFKGSDKLYTQMKSVGEAIGIGSSFAEAFMKTIESLEGGNLVKEYKDLLSLLRCPSSERYYQIFASLVNDIGCEEIVSLTGIDSYYIQEIANISELYKEIRKIKETLCVDDEGIALLKTAKSYGFSDELLSLITGFTVAKIKDCRVSNKIVPFYGQVQNNGALYQTYKNATTIDKISSSKKVLILGSGPNRIGQGAEFDYCIVQCYRELVNMGYEVIIVNNNPASVTVDICNGNKVYIEPISLESISNIVMRENPIGVFASFGGYKPYSLVEEFNENGIKVLDLDNKTIALTEDKMLFKGLLGEIGINTPLSAIADSDLEAQKAAYEIGFPIIVRPSYVIGGNGMQIIHDNKTLSDYMCTIESGELITIEKFLTDAQEVEVNAICCEDTISVPQIMENIEYAGIHSGDSDCVIPPKADYSYLIKITSKIAKMLKVKGIINIKYAISDGTIYVLEARLRVARSVSLLSKVTGINIPGIAAKVIMSSDEEAKELISHIKTKELDFYAIKAAVFPFEVFKDIDPKLGPEMRSTGNVLGIADSMGEAFYKALLATGTPIPLNGCVMMSVDDSRKKDLEPIAREFVNLGYDIIATMGTHKYLKTLGIKATKIDKVNEGRPNVVDAIINGKVDLLVNTPSGIKSEYDDSFIRKIAIKQNICYITTLEAAQAAISGIKEAKSKCRVLPLNLR